MFEGWNQGTYVEAVQGQFDFSSSFQGMHAPY